MNIKPVQSESFSISDVPGLDLINVVLQDFEPGQGRLIVECYGCAWASYWGGMGDRTIRRFVIECGAEYIATKLWPGDRKRTKKAEKYLEKVVSAVIDALRIDSLATA